MVSDTTKSRARNILKAIKAEGVTFVVVGFAFRVDKLNDRIDCVESELHTIKAILNRIESNLSIYATEIVMKNIRSVEGRKLVKFQNEDVHMVNKHIERLERQILEVKRR